MAATLFAPWLTRRTPLVTAGLAASALTLVLSGSRASLLATLVVIVATLVLKRRTSIQRAHLVAAGAAATVLVVLVVVLPQTRDRLTSTHSVEGRLLLCLGNEDSLDLRRLMRDECIDDDGLRDAIVAAMRLKPERHHFDRQDVPQIVRFMNMTGG